MHENQRTYRELHRGLQSGTSSSEYTEIILPWLDQATQEKKWLTSFGNRSGQPFPDATTEDLWRLYALSRVNDVCLLRFQPRIDLERSRNSPWDGPNITLERYTDTFTSLGLDIKHHDTFHPFFHEIVVAEEADNADNPITIIDTMWPCLMLGDMLFSRAGVVVRGGKNFINKNVVQSSTLYWTYRRKYKKYQDLSAGWGNNSQWRTRFRRDYFVGGYYYYNVDVDSRTRNNLNDEMITFDSSDDDSLTRLERIELVKNRCFILAQVQPDNDLWPYDDFFKEPE